MIITKRQHAIIVGTLLGDGFLERRGKYSRLRVEHGLEQKDYLLWKYKELQPLVTAKPRLVGSYHKVENKIYRRLHFSTYSTTIFEPYWRAFYPNGKKTVTVDVCKLMQDPLTLAVWYMDDGYKRNDCNALRISTDAFPQEEQYRLQAVLEKQFGIGTKIHKKARWWNIYIPKKEVKRFIAIVSPYILPSLQYKITLAP